MSTMDKHVEDSLSPRGESLNQPLPRCGQNGAEDCQDTKIKLQQLELAVQRYSSENKHLRQKNKEYMLQSSSQLLVHAIQARKKPVGE